MTDNFGADKVHQEAMKAIIFRLVLVFAFSAFAVAQSHAQAQTTEQKPSPSNKRIASSLVDTLVQIAERGGRLDWYHGAGHELIAYDAPNGRGGTDLFTMRPDGSGKTCITKKIAALPKGFLGQPAWHPDGEHLVLQAESEYSNHHLYNHMAWGINADLWLIRRDGKRAERIWKSPENHGALHAHFNAKGDQIVFSQRVATGKVMAPALKRMGAGGENQWDGWHIHLANFDLKRSGEKTLSNHQNLFADKTGFFETHGFSSKGELIFSHTRGGRAFVDDIYKAAPKDPTWKPLVSSPKTWDEHAQFSPSGKAMAFVSSRADPTWRAPRSNARTLRTELFVRTKDGIHQLTRFNTDDGQRFLVSDFSWDKSGKRIALQAAPVGTSIIPPPPQIWMLEFKDTQ